MLDVGYSAGYRTLHPGEKGYAFPTWGPHLRLDYMFVPKTFAERLLNCEVITQPIDRIKAASDHCPLVAELRID